MSKNPLSWIKAVASFISKLLTRSAQLIEKYYPVAEEIVAEIVALTPTRSDDVILALFKKYGMPNVEKWLQIPEADRGLVLLHVAETQVLKQFPDAERNLIQSAITKAINALRIHAEAEKAPEIAALNPAVTKATA